MDEGKAGNGERKTFSCFLLDLLFLVKRLRRAQVGYCYPQFARSDWTMLRHFWTFPHLVRSSEASGECAYMHEAFSIDTFSIDVFTHFILRTRVRLTRTSAIILAKYAKRSLGNYARSCKLLTYGCVCKAVAGSRLNEDKG